MGIFRDFSDAFKILRASKKIQASNPPAESKELQASTSEGGRRAADILNYGISTGQSTVRKNGWTAYSSQVKQIQAMYQAATDYGAALTKPAIDIRTALICDEGISVITKNKTAEKFIEKFLKDNKLNGSNLIESVRLGEKEGKCLFVTKKSLQDNKPVVRAKPISWYEVEYSIDTNEWDDPVKATWADQETGNDKFLNKNNMVYMHYGDEKGDINNSPPPIASVITQIVNCERALYDLRESNHLFGFPAPIFEGKTYDDIMHLVNIINNASWKIGDALAIPGTGKYMEPSGKSAECLKLEMALNIKMISCVMGVPVHWYGWVDLMSNRATAETLSDLVEIGTKEIRLKWKEAFYELIFKAMKIGVEYGVENAVIEPDFIVDIPQASLRKIKEMIEAWFILTEAGYVAKELFINKLPGIDPLENKKLLEKEQKEAEERKAEAMKKFESDLDKMPEDGKNNKQEDTDE